MVIFVQKVPSLNEGFFWVAGNADILVTTDHHFDSVKKISFPRVPIIFIY